MSFSPQKAGWRKLVAAEILGPFASRSGWIWSRQPARRPTNGFAVIKSAMGKALVARFLRKTVKFASDSEDKETIKRARKERRGRMTLEAQRAVDFWCQRVLALSNLHQDKMKLKRNASEIERMQDPVLDLDADVEPLPRCRSLCGPEFLKVYPRADARIDSKLYRVRRPPERKKASLLIRMLRIPGLVPRAEEVQAPPAGIMIIGGTVR